MPRIARSVAPGFPHHVIQRRNYQHPVFDSEDDFKQYLQWLKQKKGG
jgi:putative transposase